MPKDDWAKDRAKDIARRGIRMEQIKAVRYRKKRKKANPARKHCIRCKSKDVTMERVRFHNGSVHIKNTCGECDRFIKWG